MLQGGLENSRLINDRTTNSYFYLLVHISENLI